MHRALARLTLIALVATATGGSLAAWQWPLSAFDIEVSFGAPTGTGVSPGLDLVSESGPVLPADDGEVIFAVDAARGAGGIPHGLGSFVVIEHDGGFRSLYAHLDRSGTPGQSGVSAGDALGEVGRTGFSGGNTLGFRIIDAERGAYVNPMILLPELEDGTAPAIVDATLFRGNRSFPVRTGVSLPVGPAELTARVFDPAADGPYRSEATPRSVVVFVNGQEVFSLVMETLEGADGEVRFAGAQDAASVYTDDGLLRLGRVDIGPGNNLIEIIAEDHAGNERVVSFRVAGESAQ